MNSNAGGGGERVLWTAIKAIQKEFPKVISVVYSGDTDVTPETILDNVRVSFFKYSSDAVPIQYLT